MLAVRISQFGLLSGLQIQAWLLGLDSRSLDAIACAEILGQLTPGFESKALCPPATGVQAYPLQEAIAAYEQVLNRTATCKVTLTPKH
jgi:hypothetical protein